MGIIAILKERGKNETMEFCIDTNYFGFGSYAELEKAHNRNYKKKLVLSYIGLDSWKRPVYKDETNRLFVDVDNRKHRKPEICTKYNNEFDGEPDTPIEYIQRCEDIEIEFLPERIIHT